MNLGSTKYTHVDLLKTKGTGGGLLSGIALFFVSFEYREKYENNPFKVCRSFYEEKIVEDTTKNKKCHFLTFMRCKIFINNNKKSIKNCTFDTSIQTKLSRNFKLLV